MAAPLRTAIVFLLSIFSFVSQVYAQDVPMSAKEKWVDSVYNQLTEDERIGQLFMVAAYSGGKNQNGSAITKLLQNNQIGGLIFMQGTAEAQAVQHNTYQHMSKVPLLIGMDAEWGLGMRLKGVKDLPRSMMIGATMDTTLAYRIGAAIAKQCKRMGVHVNFGPVVDVNNNPNNPIINARSYGQNKFWVSRMGIAYMNGLQNNGVMACAKHFPGHGDTETDSHKDLPTINKSLEQLKDLELYPFEQMIDAGVKSIMVAHLEVPAIDSTPNTPTTLSGEAVNILLKSRMGFKGLVFTDALNMEGVTKYYAAGQADVKAFLAGNDVLLFSQNVPLAIEKIKRAILADQISKAEVEYRVKKILRAKYEVGLANWKEVDARNATADLNSSVDEIRYQIAAAGVTFVRDRNNLINRIIRGDGRIRYVGINADSSTVLSTKLKELYPNMATSWLPKGSDATAVRNLANVVINGDDMCIIAVHGMSFYPVGGSYGLDDAQMSFLKKVEQKKRTLLVLMGNPYLLQNFCGFRSVLVGYEDNEAVQTVMSDIIRGITPPMGKLPVTPCEGMIMEKRPDLMATPADKAKDPVVIRLEDEFFIEDAGVVNPDALSELSIKLERSVIDGVFPGCQVIAAKNGRVFYNRAFGYFDYTKRQRVDTNTIYDVASLTKVLATTLAVMKLYEEGRIKLHHTVGDYLPITKGTDKHNLRIEDLLLHQAGLKSWIPFYKETLDDNDKPSKQIYSNVKDEVFTRQVAKGLYMRDDYVDSIWKVILEYPLENKGRYVYSDLDYYFLAAIVEKVTGKSLDVYVDEEFYQPMGLTRITYNPLNKFDISQITPTEDDYYFRQQLVHGYVHDQGASMLGGVAGHAGIFSNARDVAAVFQMLVQGGTYNGKRFFKKETIAYFTAYHSRLSRRGLGFDKPAPDAYDSGPAGDRTSGYAFGHQGFTGTCAWADPKTGVVFVFLSNRVNPSADNRKINRESTRTVVQDYICESLGIPKNRNRANVKREQMAAQ